MTQTPATEGRRVISEEAADGVIGMLEKVITEGGLRSEVPIDGYRIAAKTGTAEVAIDGEYGSASVISIAGVAPADRPEYVVVVTAGVPSTGMSSMDVATTFRDVVAQTLTHFRVLPSSGPAPEIPLSW
jgi:cell division protein FtsI (penicillin-binding protein 3)